MKRSFLLAFALALLAFACVNQKPATENTKKPEISQFVLYAERSIKIGHRTRANGDVGVRRATVATKDRRAQLRIEEHGKCVNVFSPSVSLGDDVEAHRIWTNALTRATDTEIGTVAPFPAADMPPVPLAIASGMGKDVTISEHSTQSLTPGIYGAIVLREGSTLHLAAGRYVFASLKMKERSQLLGERGGTGAPASIVDLRIASGLQMGEHTRIGPHWDGGTAKDFTIAVAGGDPASAHLSLHPPTSPTPTAVVSIGRGARVHALLAAPHGTIFMDEESGGKGAFAGFDIVTREDVDVDFESGFPASAPAQQGSQQLHDYVKAPMSSAPLIGPVPQDTLLSIAIGLPLRDPAGLTTFLRQVSDPTSPSYRHYLTPAQFGATYSPTTADYQTLIAFAQANGLSVTQTFSNNGLLRVSGPAGAIERTFYVNLNYYARPDNSSFYAMDRDPSLDLTLAVLRISGLDNYVIPTLSQQGSGMNSLYHGNDLRNAYLGTGSACSSLTGAGQSVGLFELDTYDPADIAQYEAQAGLPNVTLNPVNITGAIPGDVIPVSNSRKEVAGDIDVVASLAPGAIITPFIGQSLGGTLTTNVLLNLMATVTPLSFQISSSWNTDADTNTFQAAMQLAAQGQSLFHSSGDFGAYPANTIPGAQKLVFDEYGTSVGGTVLSMNGAGASYLSETTWSGSGGGIIRYAGPSVVGGLPNDLDIPIPDYQKGFVNSSNGGSNQFRNVPDVSAVAANLECVVGGMTSTCTGTSYSSPLWAGFVALMNQQGSINGSPPVGFINPAIYAIAGTGLYGNVFNDINDGSTNNKNGTVTGFAAVPGYDLATGLGSPKCGLIAAMVGGPGGPPPPPPPPGGSAVKISATRTLTGPHVCVKGTGFVPGGNARSLYLGIPGRPGAQAGRGALVKPDGSFDLGVDTGTETVVSCNAVQLGNTVTVTVTEKDISGGNIIGTGNGQLPANLWCANVPGATNINGGCP